MATFLECVAEDLLKKHNGDLADLAVVFPNKRAALFLNQALASLSDRPIWSPAYITISDFFRQHSDLQVADPIKAVCELHKSFIAVTGKSETIDRFYGFGQLLLADFDDIDKNDADAEKVFANIKDLHEYDDISYLAAEQREVLKRFFGNFNDERSKLQHKFLELWSCLHGIYVDFRKRLRNQGLAYEGMLYNEVVKSPVLGCRYAKYAFVGFNVLQKVERDLFLRLKHEGKAVFYWDFDKYYLNGNEAGMYIRRHLEMFPNELFHDDSIYDNLSKRKDITFISASTENIQARYVSEWLKTAHRAEDGNKTAVVLCNEDLLQTVIHSIPENVKELNVTTGYPLQQTPAASLVAQIFSLFHSGYASKQNAYRLRYINMLLRHPYSRYISENAAGLLKSLNEDKVFYARRETLCMDTGLSLLFGDTAHNDNHNFQAINRIKSVIKLVAVNGAENKNQLFQESLFRMYTLLNRLSDLISSGDLDVDGLTLQRLVNQLVSSTSIPFHGEPAVGVQIMGVLETRNLDFEHVLVLSCNEGNMPKDVDAISVVPHALRSVYGLTTADNKVAVYSYYFHRLLQRAKDITILYNNSTEGYKTGEMSRFMLQLMVELGQPIKRESLRAGQIQLPYEANAVVKNETVMERLNAIKTISPTAINRYIRCQILFYYNYVAGIKEHDDTDEDKIDNRIFGNIFHRAAQLMYEKLLPKRILSQEPIDRVKRDKKAMFEVVEQAVSEELFNMPEGTVHHPELNGLQLISREVIIRFLGRLLETDRLIVPFGVLTHETEVYKDYIVKTSEKEFSVRVGGRIDRLDEVGIGTSDCHLRVVDYKTGYSTAKGVKTMEEVFDAGNIRSKHSDYILQSILYSLIESTDDREFNPEHKPVSPALLFIQHTYKDDYSPVITLAGERITDARQQCGSDFERLLKDTLSEMYEPTRPFVPTSDMAVCQTCPYKALCGR